ncbi:leucine--tRNA ligase [Candidatus Woesearchaeota archaeon]|nr:leucine--tRNA ligase [Candidatus Woesearchaeota archaeon]
MGDSNIFNQIALKWQKRWEDTKIFEVKAYPGKKKFYCLEMYPYPSASGLHMGHARNYVIGDVLARYKRMNGYNVLYPMGYDSFGLPAENAAIQAKSHPKIFTEKAITNFIRQQKSLGLSYDWTRKIMSHSPEYYKWDQWTFLKMLEKGLAYKKQSLVNWCSKCNTVLANEQVTPKNTCWRHTNLEVESKELNQWYLKITDYAEQLLEGLDKLYGWTEEVKTMQRNWIGKSHGTKLWFDVIDEKGQKTDKISTYTTRPDTVYGITYLVLAVEHPKVIEWTKGTEYEQKAKDFIQEVKKKSIIERTAEGKEKNGMFLGKYFINPFTGDKCPLWIADYALYDYGTGAVMAVPAHDQRDFEFAKKYNLPIKVVISPTSWELNAERMSRAYIDPGILVESQDFNGMNNKDAIDEITNYAEQKGWGKRTVNYKLRDWLISRQRFWGCPIPIVYCDACGIVPVPEKDLPVILPEDIKFEGAENPLTKHEPFINTKCPNCGKPAKRETDTMDTFIDSSWYFIRYCDPANNTKIFDSNKVNYWLPIDQYIGGTEHATGHLIYFRFFTKFYRDLGLLKVDEPAVRLYNQGMLHLNGSVMSKSKGNVVLPEEVSEKYGIDTGRFYMMFVASPDKDMEWSSQGVEGSYRFLKKFFDLLSEKVSSEAIEKREESKLHSTIKQVTENIKAIKYNKAIISIMQFTNYLHNRNSISKQSAEALVKLISPFTPHISEELWEKLGHKQTISFENWPLHDENKIDAETDYLEEMLDNTRNDIISVMKLTNINKANKITLFVAEEWKYALANIVKQTLAETRNPKDIITKAMQDPQVKSKSQQAMKLIPKLTKESNLPKAVASQRKEHQVLNDARKLLEKEFKCTVVIVKEQDSNRHAKAVSALPGKCGVLLE